MTLLQLTYVLELNRSQSFSLAASRLSISQPALSLQIGKLEEELEMKIFKRTAQKVIPTSEGEIFIEKASELIQLSENLKDLPFELEERPEGELKIGVIPTLAPYWLPLFLDNFSHSYPHIRLTVLELKTEEVIIELKNGTIDVGFISTPIKSAGLVIKNLFYEKFYLYVSESHKLFEKPFVDIAKVDLKEMWYLQEGNCFQNQVNSVCSFAKEPHKEQNLVYLSNSIESLCKVVDNVGGITFIPELATLAIDSEKEELIKSIKPYTPIREISMITTKFSKGDRLVALLLEKAMEVIPHRMKLKPESKPLDTNLKV